MPDHETPCHSLLSLEKRVDELREDVKSDLVEMKQMLHNLTAQISTHTIEVNTRLSVIQTLEEKHTQADSAIKRAFDHLKETNVKVDEHEKDIRFSKGAIWAIVGTGIFIVSITTWFLSEEHDKLNHVYEYVLKSEARQQ